MTFKHNGDLGDIIYALPTIKALGGGDLYLEEVAADPSRGRVKAFDMGTMAALIPLLRAQPYIHQILPWTGQKVDVDFNPFRGRMIGYYKMNEGLQHTTPNLVEVQTEVARVQLGEGIYVKPGPWLHRVGFDDRDTVVFARSARYHNPLFPWNKAIQKYEDYAWFLGLKHEHDDFCSEFNCHVPLHETKDLLEAAATINGCKLFVGGQSCLYPIAEGLGKRAVLEVWPRLPSNLFFREGVVHGWNQDVILPEIEPTQ